MMNLTNWSTISMKILLVALGVTFLAWLSQFHWRRRRLYYLASKFEGSISLPIVGHSLDFVGEPKAILHALQKLTAKYSSPVKLWVGPYFFLLVTQPDQMEVIMNSAKALEKADVYKFATPILGTGILFAPVEKWKRHRKLILPTFNQKILNGFVDIFVDKSEILVEQLKKVTGKPIDVFEYVSLCTIDIFCETAMGVTANAQTLGCEYPKWVERGMTLFYTKVFQVWYHIEFIAKLSPHYKEYEDLLQKVQGFTSGVVHEKREAWQNKLKEKQEHPEALDTEVSTKQKPFLQLLIELSEESAHFTDEELREEVDTFMIAGTDTTAVTNSFALIMMGMHPEYQAKVYEEILDTVGSDRPVESKDLHRLQYLERVIKETLRLFPVFPFVARSITEELQLNDGRILPVGCTVGFALYSMHRDPKFWPDPLRFDPDRFLPEEIAKRHPYSFMPFSGGPRNCIGIKYGMMAMKCLLVTVIRKYKIFTDYKSVQDIELTAEVKLKPVHGYQISVELRE